MNKLAEFFYNVPKKHTIHKWKHYFEIYDKHFKKFIGKSPVILEIGVSEGGSLDMWNYYFDNDCTIYGLDIGPSCKSLEAEYSGNVHIVIGDQGSPQFWDTFLKDNNVMFDIIIDDGGHLMHQQILSYEKLYSRVKSGGVYLCEDTHTSYWPGFGGGYLQRNPMTFVEYSKNFIDYINAYHVRNQNMSLDFRKNTHCISFYDSVVVLDKKYDDEVPSALAMTPERPWVKKLDAIHQSLKINHGSFKEEYPEQLMAARFLKGHEKVLELGANIGRNTLIIASLLNDQKNLVTLECDPNTVIQLTENRDINSMQFHIEGSALSKRPLIQKGWDTIVSDTVPDGYIKVSTIDFDTLQAKYSIEFDTIVADCEGALYYIFMDMPEMLTNIKTVIMENDYRDINHKYAVDSILGNKGFKRAYSEAGGWGPCHDRFFEVWQK